VLNLDLAQSHTCPRGRLPL